MENLLRGNSSRASALRIFDALGGGSSLVHCQRHSEAGITERKVTVFNNVPLSFLNEPTKKLAEVRLHNKLLRSWLY
jgi:hypothetical protein